MYRLLVLLVLCVSVHAQQASLTLTVNVVLVVMPPAQVSQAPVQIPMPQSMEVTEHQAHMSDGTIVMVTTVVAK